MPVSRGSGSPDVISQPSVFGLGFPGFAFGFSPKAAWPLNHLHWSSDHLKGGLPRLAKSASRHGEVAGGSEEHIFDLGRQHPVALAFGLARDPFRIGRKPAPLVIAFREVGPFEQIIEGIAGWSHKRGPKTDRANAEPSPYGERDVGEPAMQIAQLSWRCLIYSELVNHELFPSQTAVGRLGSPIEQRAVGIAQGGTPGQCHRNPQLRFQGLEHGNDVALTSSSKRICPGAAEQASVGAEGKGFHYIEARAQASINQHGATATNGIDHRGQRLTRRFSLIRSKPARFACKTCYERFG